MLNGVFIASKSHAPPIAVLATSADVSTDCKGHGYVFYCKRDWKGHGYVFYYNTDKGSLGMLWVEGLGVVTSHSQHPQVQR